MKRHYYRTAVAGAAIALCFLGGTSASAASLSIFDLFASVSEPRAALDYSAGTLTLPTLDIPQADSNPLTFSSTWKAANALASNAVFYLVDAQQIANVSNPTAVFDPATFTVSMPNVYTSGSTNGTDGFAAQKYQVVVEGTQLGLIRIGAPLTCTAPQVLQDGQCVTPVTTAASCAGFTVLWGGYCSATVDTLASGQSTTFQSQSGNGYTGSATLQCNNGTWRMPSGSCNIATTTTPSTTTTTPSTTPTTTPTTPTTSTSGLQPSEMVAAHNKWRSMVGVAGLTYSTSLAASAQAWADQLKTKGNCMQHSGTPGVGENLYRGTWTPTSADVVDTWASEKDYYNYASNSCASGQICGHYTQLVWKNTTSVGCGVAACSSGGEVWVCQYSPAGNYMGQRPY